MAPVLPARSHAAHDVVAALPARFRGAFEDAPALSLHFFSALDVVAALPVGFAQALEGRQDLAGEISRRQ
jgi:hypothetical protein